ncbi:MAG: protein phosphatase 2C domain-containing protein [Clostridia bacterium]|nr:protein phosphatase 2C domain-containing protein [Clostridia bacterium]
MKIYRACITGTNNTKKKRACQDSCDYMLTADGFVAAALSDGAGSAKFADFASRENIHAFFNFFRKYDVSEMMDINDSALAEDIVFFCRNAQEALANRINAKLEDLSATFLGFVIGREKIIIFHLGDGAAYIRTENGKVSCVSKPDNILGMSNRTRFTIDNNACKYMRVTRIDRKDVASICIFSDGVFRSKNEGKVSKELSKIFDKATNNRALSELIDTDEAKEYGDDHSMILINLQDGE